MCTGLRTLVVATATIPEAFYEDWKHTYYRASTSLQNRQRNLDEAAELIERVCSRLCTVSQSQPDILSPPLLRLTSRKPLWLDLQPVDIKSRWRHNWKSAQV